MMCKTLIFAASVVAVCPALPSLAQVDGIADAQLLVGGQMPDGRWLAALHLTLTPEWKTYWRSPGEGGGIPPQFDWAGSQNLGDVALIWPTPMVWGDAGMMNIGYDGQMTIPLAITPMDAAQPVAVRLQVDLGVCKDICVPTSVSLAGIVDGTAQANFVIEGALAQIPTPAQDVAGAMWRCAAQPIKDGVQVTATLILPALAQDGTSTDATIVMEHRDGSIWASPPTVQRGGKTVIAVADLVPPQAAPFDLDGGDLRLTVLTGGQAIEMQGCPMNQSLN